MEKSYITIAHIAEAANVSKMSVSRTLNGQSGVSEKTRQRILEVAEQLGYDPNLTSRFRSNTSNLVGLFIPEIITPYMNEIMQGIRNAAERLSYGLVLYTQNMSGQPQSTHNDLSTANKTLVKGMIMVVPRNYEVIVQEWKERELPYVIIDHHSGAENEPSVAATNRKGIHEAMRYLLALGHQRIGFITGRMDIACSHDRLQGYRDGLAEIGLPYDEALVREGDFSQPRGFQEGQALFQLADRPTAIIASNDVMAFGVMDAAKYAGLSIGRDISIIGFDDIYMASQTYPALTTVRQPMANMGETALEMLVTIINRQMVLTPRRELPTELIIRESTGRVLR